MNNKLIAGIIAVLIVGGGSVYLLTQNKTKSTSSNSSTTASSSTKKACDLFTLADAKQVLGADVSVSHAPASETSSSDIAVTQCTYDSTSTSTTATALVRASLTSIGTSSNQSGFTQDKATYKGTDVSGIGDKAFYNNQLGQLEVSKGNYIFYITSGGLQPADHSQTQATQIAQAMLKKI